MRSRHAKSPLGRYLRDHLAGSAAGRALASRVRDAATGSWLASDLDVFLGELDHDRAVLQQLLEGMGEQSKPLRQRAGRVAESASHLLLSSLATRDRGLSRLLELETLSLGVEGKRLLWLTLSARQEAGMTPSEGDFADLADRAARQREMLEGHRRAAATRVSTQSSRVLSR